MGSKEIMFSAPLVVLLYDRALFSRSYREAIERRRGFYIALAATWLVLAAVTWGNPRHGSAGFTHGIDPWRYLLTQAGILVHYLKIIAWPWPLSIDHHWPLAQGIADVWWQGSVILLLLASTVWLVRRSHPAGVPAAAFFLVLAPTSSFIPMVTEFVAERRMYLPLACVLALAGGEIGQWLSRAGPRAWTAAGVAATAIVLAMSARAIDRLDDYRSELRLWEVAARIYPNDPAILVALGDHQFKAGQHELARQSFERALELDPAYARAWLDLGIYHEATGRPEKAIEHYRKALELRPGHVPTMLSIGNALVAMNRLNDALEQYHAATGQDPDSIEAWRHLSLAMERAGRLSEAAQARLRAAEILERRERHKEARTERAKAAILQRGGVTTEF
jgi:tetratricopeptide (TPR) repeat protein